MEKAHLQSRFYADGRTYSLDFYFDVNNAAYIDTVKKAIFEFKRNFEYKNTGQTMDLLAVPFYFTQCPDCQEIILTNREKEYKLDCQNCNVRHYTQKFSFEGSEKLTQEIHKVLEIEIDQPKEEELVLVIQPTDPVFLKEIEDCCLRHEWENVGLKHFLGMKLYLSGLENQSFERNKEVLIFKLRHKFLHSKLRSSTPLFINKLVQEIQVINPGVRSMSSSIEVNDSFYSLLFRGQKEQALALIKAKLYTDLGDVEILVMVITLLLTDNQLDEAKIYIELMQELLGDQQASTKLNQIKDQFYSLKGELNSKSGNFKEAIENYNKSIEINPLNYSAYMGLMICFQKMGRFDKVREIEIFLSSRGGKFNFPNI